ncbi:hypothetical protein [Agrobacterium rosae]
MSDENNCIYVTFQKADDKYIGHSISTDKPTDETYDHLSVKPASKKPKEASEAANNNLEEKDDSFVKVIDRFLSVLKTYQNLIPLTIELSPIVSGAIANDSLGNYVKSRGKLVPIDRSSEFETYEISQDHFYAVIKRHEEALAAINGAEHLPEIATIGLISVYDAHIANILRLVFSLHEEIILTSEREIKYSDLVKYSSLEEAKASIIDKDVEGVLRSSHYDQFSWMEKKFNIKLREGLKVWPDFVELCERRNLLTHTGGKVSAQYLKICEEHGSKRDNPIGQKLPTDPEYFRRSVEVIGEMGIKLGHVLWRKFRAKEREQADSHLNQTAMDLIQSREYRLAATLLDMGVNMLKQHHSDKIRRMMVVNLANAHRLMKDPVKANQILDREDWSATGTQFQICVAAARGDLQKLCQLMKQAGDHGEIGVEQYREWPVFRGLRAEGEFKSTFREIFGAPLVVDDKALGIGKSNVVKVRARESPNADQESVATEEPNDQITKH